MLATPKINLHKIWKHVAKCVHSVISNVILKWNLSLLCFAAQPRTVLTESHGPYFLFHKIQFLPQEFIALIPIDRLRYQ